MSLTCAVAGVLAASIAPSQAGDFYTGTPSNAPAVDGFNGKIEAFGGGLSSSGFGGVAASVSKPLVAQFGVQIDGLAATYINDTVIAVGGHLFWRDPARGLLGLVAAYNQWNVADGVRMSRFGGEGEYYLGRWTLRATAGVEWGSANTVVLPATIQTFTVPTRFYDAINLAYYLEDNFKLFVGHRYFGGLNAAALGGEWGMPMGKGTMASLFVEGRIGESNYSGVWAGLRMYFGQHDKTLIRRHREDDPDNILTDGSTSGNQSTTGPNTNSQCTVSPAPASGVAQILALGPGCGGKT